MKAFLSINGGKPIPCDVAMPTPADDGKRVQIPALHTETFEMKIALVDVQGMLLHIEGATNPHDS